MIDPLSVVDIKTQHSLVGEFSKDLILEKVNFI